MSERGRSTGSGESVGLRLGLVALGLGLAFLGLRMRTLPAGSGSPIEDPPGVASGPGAAENSGDLSAAGTAPADEWRVAEPGTSPGDDPIDSVSPGAASLEGEPERPLVESAIAMALEHHLPDRRFSPTELERLTDAALSLRRAQVELRALPADPALADRRRALVERIGDVGATFEEIAGMSLAELGEGTTHGSGELDFDDPTELGSDAFDDFQGGAPEPEYLQDLR